MTTIQHQSRWANRMPLIGYRDGVQLRLITKSDKSYEKFTHIYTRYHTHTHTHTHTHREYIFDREELDLVSKSVSWLPLSSYKQGVVTDPLLLVQILIEKVRVVQLVKKFSPFQKPEGSVACSLTPVLSYINLSYTIPHYGCSSYLHIILFSTPTYKVFYSL